MSDFDFPTRRSQWTVADVLHDHDILDASGAVVARPAHGRKDIADAIVEAMNERLELENMNHRNATLANKWMRDALRLHRALDVVRREMCRFCRAAADKDPQLAGKPCLNGCEALLLARAALAEDPAQ